MINGIGIVLFTFNLAFAIYNVSKHMFKRKKRGKVIMAFYSLVLTLSFVSIVTFALQIHDPNEGPFDDDGITAIEVLNYIIHTTMITIGVIVVITMYQVMISVRTLMRTAI